MSSATFLPFADDDRRLEAIDPRRSFTVQAPAGSGKTELLIQRFLSLLATVEKPEAIVAITFTRKAAAEVRERILRALRDAVGNVPIDKLHEQRTRDLALAALARDGKLGWDLLQHPGRLRVETIDALCMSIVGAMPWLARFGALPRIQDDNAEAYEEAARRAVLEIGSGEYGEPLVTVLAHLDNDAGRLRDLIASMLERRDQWVELAFSSVEEERHLLDEALHRVAQREFDRIESLIPEGARPRWTMLAKLPKWPEIGDIQAWIALKNVVLTQKNKWRKQCPDSELMRHLRSVDGLEEALAKVDTFPPARYTDAQWDVLRALLVVLRLSVAHLKDVFRERGVVDFSEIGQAARRALGSEGIPTELAYRLDSRIEHLLVDEFQDTSNGQFDLIEKLVSDWQPDDGRTLFLVGDPMQSIYRFRQAEVGLFLHVRKHGISNLRPVALDLTSNHRTSPSLLRRINEVCSAVFPKDGEEDIQTGRISFAPCRSEVQDDECEWKFQAVASKEEEAKRVVDLVRAARARNTSESVAILVRARTHLPAIVAALKEAGLAFRAIDVDPLSGRPVVLDLLSLTRALLHPGDRISWLAILRAPWCGFTLADLEALAQGGTSQTVWESLQDLSALSDEGQRRASRVREILAEALAERSRWPLRRWVERVWIRLGGPASLQGDARSLQDANDYLDLLEREQSGCDLRDFDRFPALVDDLSSRPDPSAEPTLQVMTIHAAKGLEFDTVILPSLGRIDRRDEGPLCLFHEWREQDRTERLLAPIHPVGAEKDFLYNYLRGLEQEKSHDERMRVMYVAMTRAKRRLYLFGTLKFNAKEGTSSAAAGSMLCDILPALTPEEKKAPVEPQPNANLAEVKAPNILRRLPESWKLPELPLPLVWEGAGPRHAEPHDPTFEWVGETLRIAGTVVHSYLQRMQSENEPMPDAKAIRGVLAHAGLSKEEIPSAAARVREALERTLRSSRGRWILAAHEQAQSEYAVTGVVDGQIVHGKVDRTFVDERGIRWIIDFKTSAHEGTDLSGFLDEQQRRYSDQMSRYAKILAPLGSPVRLGLYFPLHDEWREWDPNQ